MKQAVRMRQRQVILQGDPCVVSGMRALRGAEVPSVETDRVIDVV